MPKGALSFTKSNERIKARKSTNVDYPKIDYFTLTDGQKARVRFLEQGDQLTWAQVHRVPVNNRFAQDVICLDQEDEGTPCPACQSANDNIRRRSTKGFINVIWRGNDDVSEMNEKMKANGEAPYTLGPVYKRNQYGSPEKNQQGQKIITGFEDGVFLWKPTKTVFEAIISKDTKYKGVMSRDFEISRQGAGKEDTKYFVEPADVDGGPQPMLIGDQVLAEKKYDIDELTAPMTFAEMQAFLAGESAVVEDSSPTPQTQDAFGGQGVVRSSAFGG